MTSEEFNVLQRGDVIQWTDGMLGLVTKRDGTGLHILWEEGTAGAPFGPYNNRTAGAMTRAARRVKEL